jgi:uncharacterized protein (TIGR02246 family)
MRHLIAGIVLSAVLSTAQAAEAAKAAPAPKGDVAAVKALIADFVAAFDRKDAAGALAPLAKDADSVTFGTDAAENWVGYEPVKAAVEKQFKAMESQTSSLRDLRVKIFAGGNGAVATYLLDARGKSTGEAYDVKGLRVTAVLEKRKGNWVIVSAHSSVPVAGQAVKY